ncbi:MAG: hydroxydechloroatrazine ethylaminohydrolase [Anaerolineae bacterium SM23_ 63]|nr:MAG: hydroxydechloroatrazine ethylaminohydrolase [Anaerolineae bacterium SM23_ 63]
MATLLIRHATVLVTMDGERREIHDGALLARDGWIEQVGLTATLPNEADNVIDLTGHLVLPGLVNTHHHFYQTLTRALPAAQDANLFHWLKTHYPIWAGLLPEDVQISTKLALAELALSGCTTASDHLYIFPNGCRLDDEIEAARELGLRLHASRGSMSLGESQGGLPPDSVVEKEEDILEDTRRVIETYHDPQPGAMTRIVVAPCSPFSVTPDLMRQAAALARSYDVPLHTHLAETLDEEKFCLEQFGHRPLAYAEELDWAGEDVWFAHAVHINPKEVGRMATSGIGVAHCPSSNMRLASGIAPIRRYLAAGVKVGIGVDGSASNDGSHLLAEARQAMLISRVGAVTAPEINGQGELLTARQALEMATRGGAAVLGRKDIGSLEPGKCADFIAIDLNRVEFAGGLHDPVASLVFCASVPVDFNYVHGNPVVVEGRLVTSDLEVLIEAHNQSADRLVNGG